MISIKDVASARERIKDRIYLSPCTYSETISRMTANRAFFKDNLQITGSFIPATIEKSHPYMG